MRSYRRPREYQMAHVNRITISVDAIYMGTAPLIIHMILKARARVCDCVARSGAAGVG